MDDCKHCTDCVHSITYRQNGTIFCKIRNQNILIDRGNDCEFQEDRANVKRLKKAGKYYTQ